MKSPYCVSDSILRFPARFLHSLGAPILIALALASPVRAQSDTDTAATTDILPAHLRNAVQVMVELNDTPAAVTYASALKQAQVQYDAQRNYALQHPNLRASQSFLKKTPQSIQISSTAATQVKNVV